MQSSKSNMNRGLVITSDTTPEDVVEFVEKRLRNPTHMDGVTVFNLSSYDVKERELKKALDTKLSEDLYLIPHQVTSAHGFIMTVLPEALKDADILVYAAKEGEYRAYTSLYSEMSGQERAEIQERLGDIVEEQM